jgi:co-chaperonin GroES (HSP10)
MKTLLGPRLLVELEPESEHFKEASSLVRPETVHETAIGFGKVLMLGTGVETKNGIAPIEGVEEGDRVAFIKFLAQTETNKALSHSLDEDQLIIELKDVVVVIPG